MPTRKKDHDVTVTEVDEDDGEKQGLGHAAPARPQRPGLAAQPRKPPSSQGIPGEVLVEDDVSDVDNIDIEERLPKSGQRRPPPKEEMAEMEVRKSRQKKRASMRVSSAANALNDIAQDHLEMKKAQKEKEEQLKMAEEAEKMGLRAAQMHRAMSGFDPKKLPPWRFCVYRLVSWGGFDSFIGLFIVLNGITIGFETQINASIPLGCDSACNCREITANCLTVPMWIDILNYVFFGVYFVELALRMIAFGLTCFQSNWVRFDAFLVLSSTLDLILSKVTSDADFLKKIMLVRMARLARLARMVRLMVQFATLWKLVQGLMGCVNTLLWTFILLMIMLYISALFGMELIQVDLDLPLDHPYNVAVTENFRDLWDSIMMLLQCFSWDSIAAVYRPLIKHRIALFLYFMAVLLLMAVALMNLVTAIMVEGSLAMAEEDKDVKKAMETVKKKKQMEQLKDMFLEIDEDGSGELSLDEILDAPEEILDSLIEIAGTDDIRALFEVLDYDGGGTVGTEEFCEGVFKANNSEKPMELGRLLKQCSDIMENNRRTVKILKGQDPDADTESVDGGSESGSKGNSKEVISQPKDDAVVAIEERVQKLEHMASTMQQDCKQILELVVQNNFSSSMRSSSGTKRALAVCKGRIGSPTPQGSKKEVEDFEMVELKRRVSQLEAQLSHALEGRSVNAWSN